MNQPGNSAADLPASVPGSQPVPDDKDWTWVLDERCPECGFDASAVALGEIAPRLRATAAQWPGALARPGARTRPSAQVWSPLEYGCHVRDVLRIFAVRTTLMLDEDDPTFANWDQDESAITDRYAEQDPAVVAGEIVAAGESAAAAFERVGPGDWQRSGTRSNGSRFTIESLGRYFLHDLDHHAWDVRA